MATVPRLDSIAQTTPCFPSEWTLADIHRLLGDIPLNRIVIQPPLGSATESDVERRRAADGKLFELEYGILVEKAMGWYESIIGILVSHALRTYLDQHDLGQAPRQKYPDVISFNRVGIAPRFTVLAARWARG